MTDAVFERCLCFSLGVFSCDSKPHALFQCCHTTFACEDLVPLIDQVMQEQQQNEGTHVDVLEVLADVDVLDFEAHSE